MQIATSASVFAFRAVFAAEKKVSAAEKMLEHAVGAAGSAYVRFGDSIDTLARAEGVDVSTQDRFVLFLRK